YGGVEREDLVQERIGELVLEDFGVVIGVEVAVLLAGLGVGEDYPVDELLEAVLTLRGTDGAAEVLRGDDRRLVGGPEIRELHALLGEDHLAGLPVLLFHITLLPRH